MSLITERVKAHYESRRELKGPIDVPEWGTPEEGKEGTDGYKPAEPLKIYYKIMNLATQDIIYNHVREGSLKSVAQTIVTRALNEDGEKLFRPIELSELYKHADPDILSRIVVEMSGETDEDAIKN